MAETGNIAWDWHSVYQALAFRVGMKGMEAHFPKLTKKWEDRTYKAGEIRIGMNVPKNLKATMTPDKYATMVKRNAKLDPATRATEVAQLINVGKLTPEQYTALTKAHDTGKSGHGKWTQNELLDKYTILVKEGKFSQPQARQILEYGYTGKEPQQFMGDVNGFIISKRNGVNISTFQKDGYDLTDIGFEGWNVKQSQKKGNSTYTLTHPTEGTHMFKTPKEVQDFLRDGHIPKQTISEPLNKE